MKPITIEYLSKMLNSLVNQGYGQDVLLVPSDEECNSYHALFEKRVSRGEDITFLNEKTHKEETRKTLIIE